MSEPAPYYSTDTATAKRPFWESTLIVVAVAILVGGMLLGVAGRAWLPDTSTTTSGPLYEKLTTSEAIFGLPAYETPHYRLYSNAPEESLSDVALRMETMYEEYGYAMHEVLKPYDGRGKVFFIDEGELFVQAGGRPHAPGVFRQAFDEVGPRLLLRNSGEAVYIEFTQLIQHEAWHQFGWHHVREGMPIWLDEGLAHHFSYGIWTGDRVVYGGIHILVLHLLRQNMPHFMPLADFLQLDDDSWATRQSQVGFWAPYMQAWSLIHFLRYADDGQHAAVLEALMKDVAAGRDTQKSRDAIVKLEGRWKKWLASLDRTTTHVAFFEAIAATLAGHLARVQLNGQTFDSVDAFRRAAREGKMRLGEPGDATWLPASVMIECERYLTQFSKYYEHIGRGPVVVKMEAINGETAVRVKVGDGSGLNLRAVAEVTDGRLVDVKVEGLDTVGTEFQRGGSR